MRLLIAFIYAGTANILFLKLLLIPLGFAAIILRAAVAWHGEISPPHVCGAVGTEFQVVA